MDTIHQSLLLLYNIRQILLAVVIELYFGDFCIPIKDENHSIIYMLLAETYNMKLKTNQS